ncbi:UNVERIFIED_CONTAM: hypothetical protein Slati_3974500 [Sesamum latifolium]|uniref:Endonuclease/exonuclease/phosphatase family protein n=1 Tax=Sesamum latifolium TaxID=2727402 RepID=A0AAW2TSK7_9LAMI
MSNKAWVCGGDFNEILSPEENSGADVRAAWQLRDFRQALDDTGLHAGLRWGSIYTVKQSIGTIDYPRTIRLSTLRHDLGRPLPECQG